MKLGELRQLSQRKPDLKGQALQRWVQETLTKMGLNPHTIYQELEMTSPLVDTHRDITYASSHLGIHSHAFYELIYTCNSCNAEYLVGAERYRLEAGDIIFIPPGVSHRPLLPEPLVEPYSRYVLWLSQDFMELYSRLYSRPFTQKQSSPSLLRTGGTSWGILGELFRKGVEESEGQADGWEAAVLGNTVLLLTQIKRATDQQLAKQLVAEKKELLDRITDYIEHHYYQPITLGILSKLFYVSSSTISHLFQQRLGVSLYRYVTQRRLIAAKSLIEKGQALERVAVLCGFPDYSGFYRAFKSTFGISPRQYRTMHPQKQELIGIHPAPLFNGD